MDERARILIRAVLTGDLKILVLAYTSYDEHPEFHTQFGTLGSLGFFFIKHSLVIASYLHFTLTVSLNVSLFTLVKERSGLSSPGA